MHCLVQDRQAFLLSWVVHFCPVTRYIFWPLFTPWKKTVPRYRLVVQGTLVCLLREGRRNQVSNPQNILLNRLAQYALREGCFQGIGWGRWWPDRKSCEKAAQQVIEMLYRLVGGLIIMSLQYGKNGHPHLHIWSARPIPTDLLAQVFTEATGWRADIQSQASPFAWQEVARSSEATTRYTLRGDSADYQPSRWRHQQTIEEKIPATRALAWFAAQGDPLDFGTGGLDVKPCACRVKTVLPVIRPFAANIMGIIDDPVSDITDEEINPVSFFDMGIHAMNGRRRSNGLDGSGFT